MARGESVRTLFAVVIGATLAQVVQPIPADPLVIDSGRVSGKLLASGVKAYFAIPFAAPPVRELRWRAPQTVTPWKGVYNADRMPAKCIQNLRNSDLNHYFGEEPTSEDCLYVNVWAPSSAKPGQKLPVLVFIYGGGFVQGSSAMANYGGESLAKKGVVYVSFNYRVGALGFMAHPELTAESTRRASGNWGLLDQVAALQWVNRNIGRAELANHRDRRLRVRRAPEALDHAFAVGDRPQQDGALRDPLHAGHGDGALDRRRRVDLHSSRTGETTTP